MALNWVYVARKDLGRGIDTFSARGGIPDGFSEALVNFDTSASGKLEKRRGYETYCGWLPWRVTAVERLENTTIGDIGVRLHLGSVDEVDVSELTPGPIIAIGNIGVRRVGDSFGATVPSTFPASSGGGTSIYASTWYPVTGTANAIDVFDADYTPDDIDTVDVSSPIDDTYLQVTVWGLTHSDAYLAAAAAGGNVVGLDTYKRVGEARPIASLGGNFLRAVLPDEVQPASTSNLDYRLRTSVGLYLDHEVDGLTKIAPLFHTTDPGSVRDRGVVYDTNVVGNYAKVTAATWHSGSGYTDYTLTWVGKTGSIVLNTQVSTSDKLSVRGLSHPQHTGDWAIVSIVSDTATETVIRVNNTSVTSAAFDATGAAGQAGVFTDRFLTNVPSRWLAADRVIGSGLSSYTLLVTSVSGTTVYVSGVTAAISLADELDVSVRRTSQYLPVATPLHLMLGDMLQSSAEAAPVQIVAISDVDELDCIFNTSNPSSVYCAGEHGLLTGQEVGWRYATSPSRIRTATATVVDSTSFTATTGSTAGSPSSLGSAVSVVDTGSNVLNLTGHGFETGTLGRIDSTGTQPGGISATRAYYFINVDADHVALALTEADALADVRVDFTTTGSGTLRLWQSSGILYGPATLTLERAITFEGGASATTFEPQGRWVPMEVPTTTQTLPRTTHTQHLTTNTPGTQPDVQSGLLNDSAYLTNSEDPVYKFDGTYVYHAGIPKTQLGLFASVHTSVSAALSTCPEFAYTSKSDDGKYFVMDYTTLSPGDRVYDATADAFYTVVSVTNDIATEDYHVTVSAADDISGSGATGTLIRASVYKYYAKLVTVDANGYVTSTAPLQSEDLVVEYTATGAIKLSLLQPQVFSSLDFARIELELYRTKANGNLFYLVNRQAVTFNSGTACIQFTDTVNDDLLFDQDSVTQALVPPPELGTGWESVPNAKSITTLDNRLLLANIRGWPEADIRLLPLATSSTLQASDLAGKILTFRKDSASAATTTDIENVARFEFVSTTFSDTFDFVDGDVNVGANTITETGHGMLTGMPCTLSNAGGALPGGTAAATTYYIIRVDNDTIKVATTLANAIAGTAVDISSAAGGGTHTLTVSAQGRPCLNTADGSAVFSAVHGLSAGNWVYLFHSTPGTNKDLQQCGWFEVSSVNSTDFTIDGPVSTTRAGAPDRFVYATTPTDIPVWVGNTGLDGNYNTRNSNPAGTDLTLQVAPRLANAINMTQRAATVAWLAAFSGQDYNTGQLIVRSPGLLSTTPEVVAPSSVSTLRLYVNSVVQSASAQVAFETKLFPSRVLRSYRNYPEIFDSPFATDATYSDSIIDVNPADGQAITAMLPFFGESAGGAASQLSQYLMVFKANSVWLVNVETRSVEKLDTRGQGCTAPKSVASTHNGVMFANTSGVYRINRDLSLATVGRELTGYFRDRVNKTAIDVAAGHHYAQGRRYKLSVPIDDSTTPNAVLVYEYDREGQGQEFGAWTTYDSHDALWWANLEEDAFWASREGIVWRVRNHGEASDYRDGASAIEATATLRAEDFDLPGTRKAIGAVTTLVEMPETDCTGLAIEAAMNLSETFAACGSADLTQDDIRPVDTTPPQRRGTHVQLKYTHGTAGEGCVLAGVQYTVAQLSGKRVKDTGDA